MKGLTTKGKQESVEKWEGFCENVAWEEDVEYWNYWTPCSFCDAVRAITGMGWAPNEDCRVYCDLSQRVLEGSEICINTGTPHAYRAVKEASSGNFSLALAHGIVVLDAIKATKVDKEAV